jgi:hypothetical protein
MNQDRWSAVDDYITEHLVSDDPVFDEVLSANLKAGLPEIDVSPGAVRCGVHRR